MNTINKMADLIKHDLHIAVDSAGNMYFYKDGKYYPHGEDAVLEMYIKVLNALDSIGDWSDRFSIQLVKYIKSISPALDEKPNLYQINLKNGIYDWSEQVFTPHTPEY